MTTSYKRLCPTKIRGADAVCDKSCIFRAFYTDPKTGDRALSCYYLHKKLPRDEDYEDADDVKTCEFATSERIGKMSASGNKNV